MNRRKKPWLAAILALTLGGPGCFYVGWRWGIKATFGWLFFVSLVLAGPHFPECIISAMLLVNGVLAWKAYRNCKGRNAEVAKAAIPGGTSSNGPDLRVNQKHRAAWQRVALGFGKGTLKLIGGFALVLAWFFSEFGLAGWHYDRMQRVIRSGMTIEEVLHTVQEAGLVNGYPEHREGEGNIGGVIAFSGPYDGHYHGLVNAPAGGVSESEAAAQLQQNIVAGRDYRIGFTFTPSYGPHWSMTVNLGPDGKVKDVQALHPWD